MILLTNRPLHVCRPLSPRKASGCSLASLDTHVLYLAKALSYQARSSLAV